MPDEIHLVEKRGYYCTRCNHIWYERPNRKPSAKRNKKYIRCNKCQKRSNDHIVHVTAMAIQCTCGHIWNPRLSKTQNIARCNRCCKIHAVEPDMLSAYLSYIREES